MRLRKDLKAFIHAVCLGRKGWSEVRCYSSGTEMLQHEGVLPLHSLSVISKPMLLLGQ